MRLRSGVGFDAGVSGRIWVFGSGPGMLVPKTSLAVISNWSTSKAMRRLVCKYKIILALVSLVAILLVRNFMLSSQVGSLKSKLVHEPRSLLGSLFFFQPAPSPKAPMAARSNCSVSAKQAREGMIKNLKTMNGKLSVRDPFIFFERDGTKLQASVEQPDHGQITHLRLTANGDIYAIGQQLSYKVMLEPLADSLSLHTKALPVLFGKPCGSIWKQLLSPCPEARATFSEALSAVFLAGYDTDGTFKSYVYGLRGEVLDLSKAPTPYYQHDCDMGGSVRAVRMIGKSDTAIMDKTGTIKP